MLLLALCKCISITQPFMVGLQAFYTGQVDRSVSDAWNWMIRFKDAVYPLAFQVSERTIRYFSLV